MERESSKHGAPTRRAGLAAGWQGTVRYRDLDPWVAFLPIFNGVTVFLAGSLIALPIRRKLGFLSVSIHPCRSAESRDRVVHARSDDGVRLAGRRLQIVSGVFDSDGTLQPVQNVEVVSNRRSMEMVVLRREPKQSANSPAHCVGFDSQCAFGVRQGLDYDGRGRNLTHVAVFKSERGV